MHPNDGRVVGVDYDVGRAAERLRRGGIRQDKDRAVALRIPDRAGAAREGQCVFRRVVEVGRAVFRLHRVREVEEGRAAARVVRGKLVGRAGLQLEARVGAACQEDGLAERDRDVDHRAGAVRALRVRRVHAHDARPGRVDLDVRRLA